MPERDVDVGPGADGVIASLWAAVRFLTILPVPAGWGSSAEAFGRSAWAFPIVGLLLGGVCAGVSALGQAVVGAGLSAGLVVVTLAVLTGGLHLDGLADSADGLCVPRPRERALEIMRDPNTGAMGVVAVVCLLLLKTLALGDLGDDDRWRAALVMPVAGRMSLVTGMATMRYLRPSGLGSPLFEKRPRLAAVWSVLVLAAAGWMVAGAVGLWAAAAGIVATILLAAAIVHRLGGTTGDTLGAMCECVEVAIAFTFAVAS